MLDVTQQKIILENYFRSQGFIVNDGIKYGIDFLLYTDDPSKVHSKYGVLIESNHSFFDLMGIQRVCNSVNKELLVVIFENEKKFEILSIQRFIGV